MQKYSFYLIYTNPRAEILKRKRGRDEHSDGFVTIKGVCVSLLIRYRSAFCGFETSPTHIVYIHGSAVVGVVFYEEEYVVDSECAGLQGEV